MPTREELHNLINALPDEAVEMAHRSLTYLQVWPPEPTFRQLDMQSMRQRLEDRREVIRKHNEGKHRITGFIGAGNYDPTRGAASSGMSGWDGDTHVIQTYRQHQGHELMTIESIRVDGERLVYKHEVTGPGDKRDEHEVVFDLSR